MILRQSTDDQQVALGPLMQWDEDDEALVPYTGTVNNTDIRILKAGAESEASKDSGGATHTAGGLYRAVLSENDTDTLGPISIRIGITGVEPFVLRATVVPAAVYNALVSGTGDGIRGQVVNLEEQAAAVLDAAVESPIRADVRQINGNAATPASDVAKESSVQEVLGAVEDVSFGAVIVPLLGQIQSRAEGTTIRVYTRESTTLTMAVVNAAGEPVDLSGMSLSLIIERANGGDISVIEDGDIARAGSSISFSIPAEVSQAEGYHAWSLRGSDGVVLMQGPLIVEYAPEVDQ